ncbi:hypothetical protein A2477_01640 [Candidatus Falkowbacteria bacterium RIFOXYC2_FULL_47_12]|uniref:Uncharacterized protein n=2 Tax=Candidatus Falkowiibacteriota TaxID=1752728 RepID=A0A1F5TN89_9BACT|nr:MAG: hypothetical protein A2242_03145 [Candidatus Falkowbacteria bacterium RIFOXYA2_FULL_47_9]OGF40249.1 MAG: hypothetical protein A2477_01640 [Candidatus Falkowbacteria bacterium RIFOXYC2_FULL_47_12]
MNLAFCIVALVLNLFIAYVLLKKWQDISQQGYLIAISSIIGVIGTFVFFAPTYNGLLKSFNATALASTFWGAVFAIAVLSGAIAAVAALVIYFSPWKTPVFRTLIWIGAAIVGLACGAAIINVAVDTMTWVYIVTTVVFVGVIASMIHYWDKGAQNRFSILVGYINILIISYTFAWGFFGYGAVISPNGIISTLVGNMFYLQPFILANVLVGMMCWVLGMKATIGRYALSITCMVEAIVLILTVALQLTGHINRFEVAAVRLVNQAKIINEDYLRKKSFSTRREGLTLSEAEKKLQNGFEKQNSAGHEEVKLALASAEEHLAAQRQIKEATMEVLQGYREATITIGNSLQAIQEYFADERYCRAEVTDQFVPFVELEHVRQFVTDGYFRYTSPQPFLLKDGATGEFRSCPASEQVMRVPITSTTEKIEIASLYPNRGFKVQWSFLQQ